MVVPRTSGCNLKRPATAEPEEVRLIDSVGNLHSLFQATITDIFNKFDLVISHTIDFIALALVFLRALLFEDQLVGSVVDVG